MKPWFDTIERHDALRRECEKWLGTPFSGNGATLGVGVSCQKLVATIYANAGFSADLINVPDGPMAHWRFAKKSLIEKWMSERTDFVRLTPHVPDIAIGDLLGFRLGQIIHHLGISIGKGRFVHSIEGAGVSYGFIFDATWLRRFAALWRPIG